MLPRGARDFSVNRGLGKAIVDFLNDAFPLIAAIRSVEPLRPDRPVTAGFIQGRRHHEAAVLTARIACECEMHVVVAPDHVQVKRLTSVGYGGRRRDEWNEVVFGD